MTTDIYQQALQLAESLEAGRGLRVQTRTRKVELTEQGRTRLAEQTETSGKRLGAGA